MKETVRRALRTFFQAAAGYVAANLAASAAGIVKGGHAAGDVLVTFVASAVACGIAAVMNLPKKGNGGNTETEKNETENNDG